MTTSRKLEPDQERWWFGKTILFALFSGIALLVLGHWITVLQSRNVYVAAAITGAMAWAVLTTFRCDWKNAGFWVTCAVLLVMHGALMWVLVISRPARVERNDALSIAIPECAVMVLILVFARAKNYFAP